MSCIDSRTGDRFGCIHNLSLWQGCRLILSFAFPEDFDAEMPGDIPPFLPRAEDGTRKFLPHNQHSTYQKTRPTCACMYIELPSNDRMGLLSSYEWPIHRRSTQDWESTDLEH